MTPHRRFAVSAFLSTAVFVDVLLVTVMFNPPGTNGDFSLPLCGAERLLRGIDPYSCNNYAYGRFWPSNPLTTILFVAAFLPLAQYAGPVIFSFCSAVLAFAATYKGAYWKLLVFGSLPFWHAMTYLQWSPLLLAIYFLPGLLPLALIKPHIALPIILSKLNRQRLTGLAAFSLFTLVIDPTWPLRWWPQAQAYDSYIPLMRFPFGPLILLAFLNWREPRSLFLVILSLVPQHSIYDLLVLYALPASGLQMLWLVIIPRLWPLIQLDYRDWNIIAFYLPALCVILSPLLPKFRFAMRHPENAVNLQ